MDAYSSKNVINDTIENKSSTGNYYFSSEHMPDTNQLKKSIVITLVLNLLFPGSGYAYHDRWLLGVIAFVITLITYLYTFGLGLVIVVPIMLIHTFFSIKTYNQRLEDAS